MFLQGVSVWTWVRQSVFREQGMGRTGIVLHGRRASAVSFPGWWGRKPGGEAWHVAKTRNTQRLV